MLEKDFQSSLKRDLEMIFPNCVILKNDSNYIQGFPDLLILYKTKWAALECKKSNSAHKQPNQEFYINKLKNMSYASFICPENKKEVINELCKAFGVRRPTRFFEP